MPADVELARRTGVELIRTGSWSASSGPWNPTPGDLAAAVEAQQCPAVRRPRLKLGHTDDRFNIGGDGEPALGWIENLRLSDGGNTLLGDQVALPWLSQVQAAAYPDRSIEGAYKVRCSAGHEHPFVLTAVALLGVTPPAVTTLRSIQDLPEMLGVAASSDVPDDAQRVHVTILAADAGEGSADNEPAHTGAMVALIPTAEDAARLAIDGGEPADELHVTLMYLGEAAKLGAQGQQDVINAVSSAINGMPTVDAEVFSAAIYKPDGSDPCLVYQLTGDMLDAVHSMVSGALVGVPIPDQLNPWFAHATALYGDDLGRLADLIANLGPVTFDRVRLAFAGEVIDIPLIDDPADVDPAQFDDDLQVPNILMPVAAASADKLRDYWVHGKGAAKIRWGEKNDFYRCVKQLKRFVTDPKGLCNTYHRAALGVAPGQEDIHASADPSPDLPAAEPEHEIQPEEDPVSLSDDMRSRLGLDAEADEAAALAAIDELKAKADTPAPAEPTAEMVAASAAATEKATRAESALELMREELTRQSTELATIKASAASTVKASFFGGLLTAGKLKPADRETWEGRYDRDPEMVADILSGRAEGSEVPVMASGTIGSPEPESGSDDEWNSLVARLDGPNAKAV